MASARIVEPVYVLEDCYLRLAPRLPSMSPDEFSFYGFEERLDGGIIIAISFARHRYLEPVLAQDFLIVVRTILAATIGMMNAALGRLPEGYGHLQRTDRKITFHPIADCPADHTP